MKASMITACILCCLAQGLGFDFFSRAASFPLRGTGIRASIHTANGIPNNRPLMNRSFSSRGSLSFVRVLFPTTPLRPTITFRTASAPSRDAAAAAAASSSSVATKMVLRPDWEREGRVFGLRMPPKKKERAFEYLVDYPCEFEIKVIGVNEGSFADDIATIVSKACQVEASDVRFTVRDTSSGKYRSITVHAPVTSASMLYRCYELISEDPRVKFKF